ncbi:MAG: hypothetical protein E7C47_09615 [Veillonella sp.]|uniref:hypothetical protein n=1 Tax=Veillonella sp. TaxID=1926307 RepID=UPI0028FF078A|nr:hypothetical protein [Veillonella sp.]MDU2702384.1 hypothetical protein [Veillonella sp.]
MRFIYKTTGEIKEAYSIVETKNKFKIKFSETGKDYWYDKENIELIKENDAELIIYSLNRECYKCKNKTKVYTYITYTGSNESLSYPWDKKRLNENQSLEAALNHMQYPSIEFYPIDIIGANSKLDKILTKVYPNNIKNMYSRTQRRSYAMNICNHCKAKQGEFFIYEEVNKIIKNMKEIKIEQSIKLDEYAE